MQQAGAAAVQLYIVAGRLHPDDVGEGHEMASGPVADFQDLGRGRRGLAGRRPKLAPGSVDRHK